MGLTLKTFIFALAAHTLVSSQCIPTTQSPDPEPPACPPNKCWVDGCEVDLFLCKIECGTSSDEVPIQQCTVTPIEDPAGVTCPDVSALKSVNAEMCEEFCVKAMNGDTPSEPPCRFWRYDKVSAQKTSCYLLSSDHCQYHKECAGDCDCGDVGCPAEEGGTATDPPEQPCKSGIAYNSGPAWIHWACYNFEHEDDLLSPYNPAATMFPGTVCYTTHRCSDWDEEEDRLLWLKCDGNTGEWIPDPGHPANSMDNYAGAVDTDTGIILDQECRDEPKNVLVVIIDDMGSGAQLSCETPDADEVDETYTIMAPNKCVLLCDFHLGLIIEGRLNDAGNFAFYIENDVVTQENVDIIKCW